MSKYTTEVRFICENYAELDESVGYSKIDEVISKALPKLFDFEFPIFDETYRSVLETKIIKHFYTREIGAESVGLWKHWLCTRLNEIMPYYNQLYKSAVIDFNPLYDMDLYKEGTAKDDSTRTDHNKTEGTNTRTDNLTETTMGDSTHAYSDTPQGALTGVLDRNYLTNASQDIGSSTTTNRGTQGNEYENEDNNIRTFNNTNDYTEHVYGKTGGYTMSKALMEFRETLINVDMRIIDELNDLFFNLW